MNTTNSTAYNDLLVHRTHFGRSRRLHTHAVIFAIGGCALFANADYTVQRTCQTRLFAFWGWQLVIVLAAITLPLGYTRSKEYAELQRLIDVLVTIIWVAYAGVFFRSNQACATGAAVPNFSATKCRTFLCFDFPLQTFGTKLPRRVDCQPWTTGQATRMCSAICPTICVKGSQTMAHAACLSFSPVVPPFARYMFRAWKLRFFSPPQRFFRRPNGTLTTLERP